MLKYIISLFIFVSIVHATTITSQKTTYTQEESLLFTMTQMSGDAEDWIGIYPAGANNDWENVIAWKWSGGIIDGEIAFSSIAPGDYEVRAFFQNSFVTEASDQFTVTDVAAAISTDKTSYIPNENITVTVENLSGDQDWVGIYPVGSNNDWENVRSWAWASDGTITLDGITGEGTYEARLFFHNSFSTEATTTFSIQEAANLATINTSKSSYNAGESIILTVENLSGDQDWVGIYPVGSSNDWENVLAWAWASSDTITLEGLSEGTYEARLFFHNSFSMEATSSFSVVTLDLPPTVYEDAENGISGDWVTTGGNYAPIYVNSGFNSSAAVQLKTEWIDDTKNISEYQLDLHSNKNQHILEVDVGGVGNAGESPAGIHSNWAPGLMPHYKIGVIVTTTQGYRLIMWSSFYTHSNIPATKRDYGTWASLTFPSPWEQVRWDGNKDLWEKHRFDIQEYINILEPGNTIISVDKFIATGGNLDNITLKSN